MYHPQCDVSHPQMGWGGGCCTPPGVSVYTATASVGAKKIYYILVWGKKKHKTTRGRKLQKENLKVRLITNLIYNSQSLTSLFFKEFLELRKLISLC